MNATAITPQPDLFDVKPDKASRDVAWLENTLRGAGCWMTSGDILLSINLAKSDDSKRWLRELASASVWILSGQKGYKHIEHASAEEIHHAASWLESQAKKMADRAGALRHNAHKIFG